MMEWKEIDALTDKQMWGTSKDEVIYDMVLRKGCGYRFIGRVIDNGDIWHNDAMVAEDIQVADITHFAVLTDPTPKDK